MRMDVLRSILLKSLTLKQKIDGKIFQVSYCKPLTRATAKTGSIRTGGHKEKGEYCDHKEYGFQRRSVPRGR
jgi:hypothetical protein